MGMAEGKSAAKPFRGAWAKNDLGNMDLHPFRVFTEVLVVLAAF